MRTRTEESDPPKPVPAPPAPPNGTRGRRVARFVWRWTKRAAIAGAVLAILAVLAVVLVIRHYESDLPSVADVKSSYHPPQVTRVLARDGTLLAELFTERRTVVSIQTLPPHVKLAVLAAEDAGFYEHKGLDYLGMMRAFYVNARHTIDHDGPQRKSILMPG